MLRCVSKCVARKATAAEKKREASRGKPSRLLELPLEIRLEIYDLLDLPRGRIPLNVCRQIRNETLPISLKTFNLRGIRTLTHEGTRKTALRLLPHVREATIGFEERDLGCFQRWYFSSKTTPSAVGSWDENYVKWLRSGLPEPPGGGIRKHTYGEWLHSGLPEPHGGRLRKQTVAWSERHRNTPISSLREVFEALSHLRTMYMWSWEQHFIEERKLLMEIMASRCRELRELSVIARCPSLEFLRYLPHLQHLLISGRSLTPPEETLEILQGLKELKSLSMVPVPPPGFNDPVSITPVVLAGMNPLQHLTIDIAVKGKTLDESTPMIMTAEMVRAILAHADTLQTLKLEDCGCLRTLSGYAKSPDGVVADTARFRSVLNELKKRSMDLPARTEFENFLEVRIPVTVRHCEGFGLHRSITPGI